MCYWLVHDNNLYYILSTGEELLHERWSVRSSYDNCHGVSEKRHGIRRKSFVYTEETLIKMVISYIKKRVRGTKWIFDD
jgi:hypothetical protein